MRQDLAHQRPGIPTVFKLASADQQTINLCFPGVVSDQTSSQLDWCFCMHRYTPCDLQRASCLGSTSSTCTATVGTRQGHADFHTRVLPGTKKPMFEFAVPHESVTVS
jgi:hypothetical protein